MINKIVENLLSLFKLKLIRFSNAQVFPVEAEEEIKKFINYSDQFSMTGKNKMYLLTQAILSVKNNNLEGDFVESGVWKGGNILLYSLLNDFYKLKKTIHQFLYLPLL